MLLLRCQFRLVLRQRFCWRTFNLEFTSKILTRKHKNKSEMLSPYFETRGHDMHDRCPVTDENVRLWQNTLWYAPII